MNDPIKAKIQELCPDVIEKYNRCMGCGYGFDFCLKGKNCPNNFRELPITLAVVLRAIEKTVLNRCIFVSASGRFYEERAGQNVQLMPGKWNLSQDSYDNQTRETQLFIGSLLGVEK